MQWILYGEYTYNSRLWGLYASAVCCGVVVAGDDSIKVVVAVVVDGSVLGEDGVTG